jgi:hypothetical protein
MDLRGKVLSGFKVLEGTYSHVLPFKYTNYIDLLFHLAMMAGAARLKGDMQLALICEEVIANLLKTHIDARNIATEQVSDKWIQGERYWYIKKPQSYVGPMALQWAVKCGAQVPCPWDMERVARLVCMVPGWLIRWIKPLHQHINTCMLAHLLVGKKPGSSWNWVIQSNAFYSYIAGVKFDQVAFTVYKCKDSKTVDEVVPMQQREGSAWIWKQSPNKRCIAPDTTKEYTPTALLVGQYLQELL